MNTTPVGSNRPLEEQPGSYLTTLSRQSSALLTSFLDQLAFEVITIHPAAAAAEESIQSTADDDSLISCNSNSSSSLNKNMSTIEEERSIDLRIEFEDNNDGDLLVIKQSNSTESGHTASTMDDALGDIHKQDRNKSAQSTRRQPVCARWTRLTEDGLNRWLRHFVVVLGTWAARHPWTTVWSVALLSLTLVGVGLMTNFEVVWDHETIFTPTGSPPARNGAWLASSSGFTETADMLLMVHSDQSDSNVLHVEAVRRVFQVLETLRSTPGYDALCAQSGYINPYNSSEHTCWIWSVTQFWDHNATKFEQQLGRKHGMSEIDLVKVLSQPAFRDGMPVFHEVLMGSYTKANVTDEFYKHHSTAFMNNTTSGAASIHNQPMLTRVPAFMISVGLPVVTQGWETEVFQERALARLQDLQDDWLDQTLEENPHQLRVQFFCQYAYLLEYERALMKDMPLALVVFAVMLSFTMLVFHQYGRQHRGNDSVSLYKSRATLGIASVVTIGASLMSGFGLMFCLGVPFTNITQMVPFIILGVGLDDTFIITGAYFRRLRDFQTMEHSSRSAALEGHNDEIRTRPLFSAHFNKKGEIVIEECTKDDRSIRATEVTPVDILPTASETGEDLVVQRIRDSLEEVGLSISLTTLTTTLAFVLGCISSIPGIQWLCLYASSTIVFDFFFQITLFVAFMVLDERRVCGTVHITSASKQEKLGVKTPQKENRFFVDRFMKWYAAQLMQPLVKAGVLVIFMAMFVLNVWSATLLEQRFNIEDYVAKDSYTRPFLKALDEYSTLTVPMGVYFRDVDQSDPEIRRQMRKFVDDISEMPQVDHSPEFCWVRDMQAMLESGKHESDEPVSAEHFERMNSAQKEMLSVMSDALRGSNYTFEEKLATLLNIPGVRDIYGEDIVLDNEGRIVSSRCYIFIRHLDLKDINDQIEMLQDQYEVTLDQPINQLPGNEGDPPFFTFDSLYYYWQLYTVAIKELMFTTIFGVVAVCFVGFIIIPHWTAICFVCPMIIMLYFNLIGTMQACGIYINAVTYVTIVISIGLLVDFLMHILLKYYEANGDARETKVKETLETMGSSILLGGFTTWLGVIPMAFSSTEIFMTLFVAFFAMVSWGVLVGLVFLPVVLSILGPETPSNTAIPSCVATKATMDVSEEPTQTLNDGSSEYPVG